jgi:hypothetical protein
MSTQEITKENVKDIIHTILESPSVSFWLKGAIKQLLDRDVVDAWKDTEILRQIMYIRLKKIQG